MGLRGYLAAEGFVDELVRELGEVQAVHGRLVLAPGPERDPAWAENVWRAPHRLEVRSVKDAARKLRRLGRSWVAYAPRWQRRAALIERELPPAPDPIVRFPEPPPEGAPGSWTLLEEHTVLASPECTSPFPNGAVRFAEDRQGPPSRAYLKLWEALTRLRVRPEPGQLCLDLGASPGGWSWVCQQLGARVVAVDKAPLDPAVAALPGVEERRQSAFALDPAEMGPVDWLLSDVVCYPERLLALVRRWLEAETARHMVCTVKLQGETDHDTLAAFAALPRSRLVHLSHNRHELTWVHAPLEDDPWRW